MRPTLGEFQSYVSGVWEGQALLSADPGVPQVPCADAGMTRANPANTVLGGLSKKDTMQPAGEDAFRVPAGRVPCSGLRWDPSELNGGRDKP